MNARSHTYFDDNGQPGVHYEEPNRAMRPPVVTPVSVEDDHFSFGGADEVVTWDNGAYEGYLRRYKTGSPLGGGEYAVLSITAIDQTARHDFRDFQQIKNMLLGEDWEALELYPAESRLVDPSNRFFLWCFPLGCVNWGWSWRNVCDMEESTAPQRPFPPPKKR